MRQLVLALAVLCVSQPHAFARHGGGYDYGSDQGGGASSAAPIDYAQVEASLPICRDKQFQPFTPNNDQVIGWKTSTQNQYLDRGYVIGRIVRVLQDTPAVSKKRKSGHWHAEVDISANGSDNMADHIEVIYNSEFGEVQNAQPGDILAACGDYITSNAPSGYYQASPMGAILHWIHASNKPDHHAPGFLSINGTLYGYQGDGADQQPEMNR